MITKIYIFPSDRYANIASQELEAAKLIGVEFATFKNEVAVNFPKNKNVIEVLNAIVEKYKGKEREINAN